MLTKRGCLTSWSYFWSCFKRSLDSARRSGAARDVRDAESI
jgi:hypothetical protein